MEENPEKLKRLRTPNKNSMRNMKQYKDMSDEEFDSLYSEVVFGVKKDELAEEKFNRLMKQFEDEYDLTEMLPNDRVVLKNLISAMLQLDDYTDVLEEISKEGITQGNILIVRELNTICKTLRTGISEMQNDLKITRNVRKADKEVSVINYLEDLKVKAKTFAHRKMHYVFCEKCGQLLATIWWQINDSKNNVIVVTCNRKTEDGGTCGWSKRLTAKDLTEMGGTNRIEVLPESMR